MTYLGEIAALLTAVCWTITAMAFESAGKRVGSLPVNLIRLILGFLFLSVFTWIYRGQILPLDANAAVWFWLSLSGLIGFVIGDLLLFQAFVIIGSRISMLIMSSVPPLTALIGWMMMNEHMTIHQLAGMFLTLVGICMVILDRKPKQSNMRLNYSFSGILFAFGGSLGQAVGLVLSKYGMSLNNPLSKTEPYDAFAGTQIRIIAGMIGFSILFVFLRSWSSVIKSLSNRDAMIRISVGSFFGPFLGVSFSLLSIQYTVTGVASTIMAIVPILIIPPAILIFKEKVAMKEVIGAVLAVAGVALLFICKKT
ncbi:DMT family transporter [bacterium]|nr:DMT family transporter [candidate division CSSED10-310 bacterium]